MSNNLYDLALSELNGKARLNTVFKDDESDEVKILTFKEGTFYSFTQEPEIIAKAPNCGSKIVSSKSYIALACS